MDVRVRFYCEEKGDLLNDTDYEIKFEHLPVEGDILSLPSNVWGDFTAKVISRKVLYKEDGHMLVPRAAEFWIKG